ncbi:hypothetical protein [Klebsiella quasipneumoniae]|uniref:hypothetical protein n=1 Tax=Klebsiella quasipneumoniae TaxID=1463165 RepID=UPI00388F2AD9
MRISDVNFGSIDAKHEVDGRTPEEIRYFEDSYVLPPNINLDDYLSGKKYYISGLKGTGKTALLRFIQIKADKKILKQVLFYLNLILIRMKGSLCITQ